MSSITFICASVIPVILLVIMCAALFKRTDIFSLFCEGAKEGLKNAMSITAPIVGLMAAIYMLRASGAIDMLAYIMRPVTSLIGLDENLLPLALLRPVSGSGSIGLVTDIVSRFGADSVVAKTACVMAGATETTFYTIAVYFGSIGIKNIRHSAHAALFADIVSIVLSLIVCRFFF